MNKLLKNVQKMVTPTNHVIVRARFTLYGASGAGIRAVWDFRNIFHPNTGKDQKNVLRSERGAPLTVPYAKSDAGYCITFIQRLDEDLK